LDESFLQNSNDITPPCKQCSALISSEAIENINTFLKVIKVIKSIVINAHAALLNKYLIIIYAIGK
jgi:hypothetical protein